MSAYEAHNETMRCLARAAELTEAEARQHLQVVLLRIVLELRGWCMTCVLNAQADATGAVELPVRFDAPAAALHVCVVIPFPRNSLSRG